MADRTKGSDEPGQLLARQRAWQTEAEHVRTELDLTQRLAAAGQSLDEAQVITIAAGLAMHRERPRARGQLTVPAVRAG